MELTSFGQVAYINGINTAQNNTSQWWGYPVDGEPVVFEYKALPFYVNGSDTPLALVRGFIRSQYRALLRAPTTEGITNPQAVFIDDTAEFDNNGQTVNLPVWVDGPHG